MKEVSTFETFLQEAYQKGLLFQEKPKNVRIFIYEFAGHRLLGPADKFKAKEMLSLLGKYFPVQDTGPVYYLSRLSVLVGILETMGDDVRWRSSLSTWGRIKFLKYLNS